VREIVLAHVGVVILELADGMMAAEVPGQRGHEHHDFEWPYEDDFKSSHQKRVIQ